MRTRTNPECNGGNFGISETKAPGELGRTSRVSFHYEVRKPIELWGRGLPGLYTNVLIADGESLPIGGEIVTFYAEGQQIGKQFSIENGDPESDGTYVFQHAHEGATVMLGWNLIPVTPVRIGD